eukprot:CAMPEP_0181197332 /NCGR_PEP_ID=MMETSP1096-20121128/15978_1 /TAXON_ID=156174 ORGANISM="Chrysochromulina ericina, Strain CCMP281" /NCGR_SAMPLE_ID=MMETSP1096 /ASSEMBLY_ACC=CAM_ASM_000453 /LENGTH=183 /DNA_ID=CAMNT_0023287223 /DNA_START=339 /DNA_END=892 /DNA_ORIENTATION=+
MVAEVWCEAELAFGSAEPAHIVLMASTRQAASSRQSRCEMQGWPQQYPNACETAQQRDQLALLKEWACAWHLGQAAQDDEHPLNIAAFSSRLKELSQAPHVTLTKIQGRGNPWEHFSRRDDPSQLAQRALTRFGSAFVAGGDGKGECVEWGTDCLIRSMPPYSSELAAFCSSRSSSSSSSSMM